MKSSMGYGGPPLDAAAANAYYSTGAVDPSSIAVGGVPGGDRRMSTTSLNSPPDHHSGCQQDFARPYRSRKERPCDLCRKRKSRCVIVEAGTPCQACSLLNKTCTFEVSPTPRTRPQRSNDDEHANETGTLAAKSERTRSQSGSSASAVAAHQQQQQSVRFVEQSQNGNSLLHQRRQSANAPRYQPYPGATPQANLPPEMAHINPFAPTSTLHRQSLPHQQSHALQQQLGQWTATSMPISPHQQAPQLQPAQPASRPAGTANRPQVDRRTSKNKANATVPKRGTASINELHDLVATMIQGEEAYSDGESDDAGAELQQPQSATDEQGALGMTPFVLGSSSSEDPVLLGQAASPSPDKTSSTSDKKRMSFSSSSSSRPIMSPPSASKAPDAVNTPSSASTERGKGQVAGMTHVRQVTRGPRKPVFFSFMVAHPYGNVPGRHGIGNEIGAEGLSKLRKDLGDKVSQLMVHYSQRDSAAFPLLMTSQRHKYRLAAQAAAASAKAGKDPEIPFPPVLATAALATGIIYDPALRPISRSAWASNLHALIEQFDLSSLVTLQVACTDLTGRPSINTSGNMMSLMQTIAIALMLGMHLDPSTWMLPREERDVRIRLWWAIVIHDKWSSLAWGRPSVIHRQDFSTPVPRRDGLSPCREHLADTSLTDFVFGPKYPQRKPSADTHTPGDTFAALCSLTQLLDSILIEFHGVHSCQSARRDGYSVASRVRSHMLALTDWRESLPGTLRAVFAGDQDDAKGTETVPGTRSLQLSFYGVLLLLCRTALDGVTASEWFDEARVMPAHRTALHATHMVVDWLETLGQSEYTDTFFLHYGSHHLASCLSLLARLALGFSRMGEAAELAAAIEALKRLLTLLASAKKKHQWDLAELAITRSLVILPQLEVRIPNFPPLLNIVAPSNQPLASKSDTSSKAAPIQAPSGVPTDALQSIGGHVFEESSAMASASMAPLVAQHASHPGFAFAQDPHGYDAQFNGMTPQQDQAMQTHAQQQQAMQQPMHEPHAHHHQMSWDPTGQNTLMMPPTAVDSYATYGASAGPALLLADDWLQLGIGPAPTDGSSWMHNNQPYRTYL